MVVINRALELLNSSRFGHDGGKVNQRPRDASRIARSNLLPVVWARLTHQLPDAFRESTTSIPDRPDAGASSLFEPLRVEQDLGPACIIAQCV